MEEKVEVFVCNECGYEDSSYIPIQKHLKIITCPGCKKEVKMNIVEMDMGKNITVRDYIHIVTLIQNNLIKSSEYMIKHVGHTYDIRINNIHRVVIDENVFSKVNEYKHIDLRYRIYGYLKYNKCENEDDFYLSLEKYLKEVDNNIKSKMTMKEYLNLIVFIQNNHSFRNLKGKMIKYISHTYDLRTKEICNVVLDDKEFAMEGTNINLIDRIYDYLNS